MSSEKKTAHDPGRLPGCAGKILHLNLGEPDHEAIPTERYRERDNGDGSGGSCE
jgi:hypothetical protein